MKWGVFSLSQIPDLERVSQSFDDDMAYFKRAEALGYDTVWLAGEQCRRVHVWSS